MLDIVGALLIGVIWAVDVIVLVGLAAIRPIAKFTAFVIAAAWSSLIFAIAGLGGFAPGVTGNFPGPVIAFLVLMLGGLVAWFASPAFRKALLSVPLAGLIGINAFRIGGVFFLMLHNRGRLAAPFSTSAGWGDIITGFAAIPLALIVASKRKLPRGWLILWNVFGTLDLVAAIALGGLSAPGTPFRLFTESPGTVAMGTLPWVAIPALIVPLYLMTHLTIAVRLRSAVARRAEATARVDNRPPDSLTPKVA